MERLFSRFELFARASGYKYPGAYGWKAKVSLEELLMEEAIGDGPNLDSLALPHPLDKRLDINDLDAVEVLEISEVRITRDDVIGLCLHRAGKEDVV
jgi:hypothetical protein